MKKQTYTLVDIFSCTRCGSCCHGETTVSLDDDDQRRMIAALGGDERKVREKFLVQRGSVVQMQTVDGHCIFYKEGCSVHEGRPWRCRQWPLHPSILAEEANFITISDSCPGIRKDISYEDFCHILKQLL